MSTQSRIVSGFLLAALLGLLLLISVVHQSSADLKRNLLMQQFSLEVATVSKLLSKDQESASIRFRQYFQNHAGFETNMLFCVIDTQQRIVLQHGNLPQQSQLLAEINAQINGSVISGQLSISGNDYYWQLSPGNEQLRLLSMFVLPAISWDEFTTVFGVPLLIATGIILWIVFWTAIIIGKLIDKSRSQQQMLQQQAIDIIKARDDAVDASQAKSYFLANMSHEIRTPLTSIIGFAESSLDAEQSMEERFQAIQTIIRSGKHLQHIINEILDLSKIEAGKLDMEIVPVSLFELLDEIYPLIKLQADEKGLLFKINYNFPLPEKFQSDPLRLKQILLNLCSNAVKFTPSGFVYLTVRYDHQQRQLNFEVADSGIGLSHEQIEKLFKPFQQADSSTTRHYGGTGLGLALSKQMVEMLGGEITVSSILGEGSQFNVTLKTLDISATDVVHAHANLPQSDFNTSVESLKHAPSIKLQGKILLAEDTEDIQRLISLYLKRVGVEVTIVNNGKEAMETATNNNFDLLLMDMQMPVMDGETAVKLLREQGYDKPIVAMTANAMREDREKCFALGCDNFLAKPINRDLFLEVIQQYLPVAKGQQNIEETCIHSELLDDPEIHEYIQKYIHKLPGDLQQIQMAAQRTDWDEVRKCIHVLKGTGGTIGFPFITQLAAQIEFQLLNKNYSQVTRLLSELEQQCQSIDGYPSSSETA